MMMTRDKLFKRIRIASENKIVEYFDHCKNHHLKQHTLVNNATSELIFYDFARPDGLYSRTYFEKKVIEQYIQRDDKLYYRSITFSVCSIDSI